MGYRAAFGGRETAYVYPPVTVLAFVPYALLRWERAFALYAVLSVAATVGTGLLATWTVERVRGRLRTVDRLLVSAFPPLTALSLVAVGLGQIDTLLAVALAGAFLAHSMGHDRLAGVGVGLGAVFKLLPGLAALWFVYRRGWRALATAVATGVGALALGGALFGVELHVAFLTATLAERSRLARLDGAASGLEFSVTLTQPLSVLVPGAGGAVYTLAALAVLAPAVAWCYRHRESTTDHLVAYLATLVAVVLVSPASVFTWTVWLLFPAVTLVAVLDAGPDRTLVLVGLAVLSVPVQRWQPATVARVLGREPGYDATVGPVIEALLTLGTMPLYGTVLLLAGCVAYAVRRGSGSPPTERSR